MKSTSINTFVLLLALSLFLGWASANPTLTGEPGCQTEEEINNKNYRHFKNKTAYWECVALDQPAVFRVCQPAHGFLDTLKECVHFSLWYWTPTVAPPSSPVRASSTTPSSVPATELPAEA